MTDFSRRRFLLGASALGGLYATGLLGSCGQPQAESSPVRIGWQTAWASQGQVIEAMRHTNIGEVTRANLAFSGFQFGPDLNEAAVSGSIDVTNAGIVPVINLLARAPDWVILARQTDFYVSIIGRPNSGVTRVADLRGRKFAVPIGGGSHPFAIMQLRAAGLNDGDVEIVNVPPTEMLLAFRRGDVDAVAVWDPTAQLILEAGGRIIAEQAYVGFVTTTRTFINRNPVAVAAMLDAYALAFLYAARNKARTDTWFSRDSGMPEALVRRLRVIEPNLAEGISPTALRLAPADQAIALCQQVADSMLGLGLLRARLDVRSRIAPDPVLAAQRRLSNLDQLYARVRSSD